MVHKVRTIVCVAVLFMVQVTIVHRFSYRFLRPDLLCLAAAYLALEASLGGALWSAFGLGILRDLGSAGRLGASPLLLIPASALLFLIRGQLVRESVWADMLLTFAYVLVCGAAHALVSAAFTPGPQAGELMGVALGQAAFTAALSPLFFLAFAKLGLVAPHP
jgi:rod shape-determining protein MreD